MERSTQDRIASAGQHLSKSSAAVDNWYGASPWRDAIGRAVRSARVVVVVMEEVVLVYSDQ